MTCIYKIILNPEPTQDLNVNDAQPAYCTDKHVDGRDRSNEWVHQKDNGGGSQAAFAGKPASTGDRAHAERVHAIAGNTTHPKPVEASLLAMDSGTPHSASPHALSLTTIASKLAPAGERVQQANL